jgi:hypothetical protein
MLRQAVTDAEAGLIEPISRPDQAAPGAQGPGPAHRVLLMYRRGERAVFPHGFTKSAEANVDDDELASLQDLARFWRARATRCWISS